MKDSAQILVSALYKIACDQKVETREAMIDVAVKALSDYMKEEKLDSINVHKKPEALN